MTTPFPLIAVLDDEAGMRLALKRLLSPRGYEVKGFDNGEELYEACSVHPIKCIILDLHADGVPGFDLLEKLSQSGHGIPVIVITSHDLERDEERALQSGASAYLTKPVDKSALIPAIEIAINGSTPRALT